MAKESSWVMDGTLPLTLRKHLGQRIRHHATPTRHGRGEHMLMAAQRN